MTPALLIISMESRPRALPLTLVVDGDVLSIAYAIALDESYTSTVDSFAVAVDGGPLAVSAVGVEGPAVVLTLESPVVAGQVTTLTYTPGVDAIRSASGVLVAGFAARAVDSSGVGG